MFFARPSGQGKGPCDSVSAMDEVLTQQRRSARAEAGTGARVWVAMGALLLVCLVAMAIWRTSERQALAGLAQQGQADLSLASDRITAQLKRYQELAVLMADHPVLSALTEGGAQQEGSGRVEAQQQGAQEKARAAARALLTAAADKTAALDIAFADTSGQILARATRGREAGELDLRRAGYFTRAMQGALGTGHGVYGRGALDMPDLLGGDNARAGASEPRPQRAYFYAAPQFSKSGSVVGALIVVVNIDMMEWDWIGGNPAVYFLDEAGEVFISNRRELLFSRADAARVLIPPDGAPALGAPARRWQSGAYDLLRLDWGPYLPTRAMALMRDLPVIGMRGVALIDVGPARRIAGLQTGVFLALCVAFAAMMVPILARRRVLARANAQLERRVARRTRELSNSNAALRREVAERVAAEAALKQAQAELVQAEKLSALGQMSAGISHELNQPLMAIQQFADNGALFLKKGKADVAGENLGRISSLAARAARIIKNLRAFARNESELMGKVNLVQVIDTAVEMTEARRERDGIICDWEGGVPVYVWGGEVRLVQVFVNLITNAADAMSGQGGGRIRITLEEGRRLSVILRDTGPGIKDSEKIFEPFYSTKAVAAGAAGEDGMGLGLSISYGLVQSFGGVIRGANAPDGGAVFTVELERWNEAKATA